MIGGTVQRRNGPECEMRNAGTKTDRDRVRTAEQLESSVSGVLGLSCLAPDAEAVRCRCSDFPQHFGDDFHMPIATKTNQARRKRPDP